ncbi:MAG: response regulator [Desulfobacteraceae bacterium]|jgi:two-component system nitrogen regulation response regulator NtrX|nr:response regulator [Desulfobacteraceae bacterium]
MRGKVLIVDDYSDWRNLLSGLIEREGHLVETAGNWEAALAHIDENKDLDLVILDIRLVETEENNEDGMRLLAEIRNRLSFTRVIMVTGYGTMKTQRKAFKEFQAFDFFRKAQFDSDEFRRSVQDAVEKTIRDRKTWKDKKFIRDQKYEIWQRDRAD